MDNELENCPFCGEPAEILEHHPILKNGKIDDLYQAACTNRACGARGLEWYPKSACVNRWNTRLTFFPPTAMDKMIPISEVVDWLEAEIKELEPQADYYDVGSVGTCYRLEAFKGIADHFRNLAPSPQTAAEPDGLEVSERDLVDAMNEVLNQSVLTVPQYLIERFANRISHEYRQASARITRAAPAAAPVAGDAVMEALNYTKEVLRNLQPLINAAGVPPMARKIGILSKIATAGAHQVNNALPMIDAALASLTPSPKPVAVDAPAAAPVAGDALVEQVARAICIDDPDGLIDDVPIWKWSIGQAKAAIAAMAPAPQWEMTEKERNKAVSLITATLQGVEGNLSPEDLWRVVATVALAEMEKHYTLVEKP